MALALKRGEFRGNPGKVVEQMSGMSEESLREYAETSEKNLPQKVRRYGYGGRRKPELRVSKKGTRHKA